MEAYTKEELTALYRRQVGMVYQICLMLLKNAPMPRTPARPSFKKRRNGQSLFVIRSMKRHGSSSPPGMSVKIS